MTKKKIISQSFSNSLAYSFLQIIGVSTLMSIIAQPSTAVTLGFENGFDDWEIAGNTSIVGTDFGSGPTEGLSQALLSTGGTTPIPVFRPPILGVSLEGRNLGGGFLFPGSQISDFGNNLSPSVAYTQGSAIKTKNNISVNAGDTLKFDYNFLTNEDSSEPIFGNDLAFFSINNQLFPLAIFTDVEDSLVDSPTPFTRETQYQEYSFSFPSAVNFTLGFGVVDGNDILGDSGLLVDNIRIETSGTTVPESSSVFGLLLLGSFWGGKKVKKGFTALCTRHSCNRQH